MTGLWLALLVMVLAAVVGLAWQARGGRLRFTPEVDSALPEQVLRHLDADAAVTLVQLTSPLCTRCPQARAVLDDLVTAAHGVQHTEVDLAEHPELADLLGVRSTPTTVAVARSGHELFRVTGVPRRDELLSALEPHVDS